jgi:hypothetical protein
MVKFLSILRNTFIQTIRQPIFAVIVAVTWGVLVLTVPLAGWTMGTDYHRTDQQFLENMGLATLLMSGLLAAAFSASGVVSREIEDRTALTVISKPVGRWMFVMGKFAGVALAVALAFVLCSLVYLMTVRHRVMPAAWDKIDWPVIVLGVSAFALSLLVGLGGNYFFNWTFTSAAVFASAILMSAAMLVIAFVGKEWKIIPFGQGIRPELLVGMVMVFMAVIIFTAVAIAASTRFGQVMTLLICTGVLLAGSMHPFLFGSRAIEGLWIGQAAGWLVPKLTYFFPLNLLTEGKTIPAVYVLLMAGYCTIYTAAVLALGVGLFQTRQLQADTTAATMPGAVGILAWAGRMAALALLLVAGVLVSLPRFHTTGGFITAGALAAGAALGWLFWTYFSRGQWWTYLLLAAGAGLILLTGLTGALVPASRPWAAPTGVEQGVAAAVVAAVVLGILLLPQTRRHFRST